MKVPLKVVKLAAEVPVMVVSTLLWLAALALLPALLGLVGFVAGATALVLLTAGVGERVATALLTRARPATRAEEAVLDPVWEQIRILDLGLVDRRLLVRRSIGAATPPFQLVGRESLVATPWLIEAIGQRRLSPDETAALAVHAVGRHSAENPRCEVAVLAWTLPWRAARACVRGIARVAGWFPFARFAWALRGVIGVVAVVQQVDEGRLALGVTVGSIVGLTYVVPAATDARARRVEALADQFVVDRGLGGALTRLLSRDRLPVRRSDCIAWRGRPRLTTSPVCRLSRVVRPLQLERSDSGQ